MSVQLVYSQNLRSANHNDCTCAGNQSVHKQKDSFVVSSTVMQKQKLRLTSCFWIESLTETCNEFCPSRVMHVTVRLLLYLGSGMSLYGAATLLGEWKESV